MKNSLKITNSYPLLLAALFVALSLAVMFIVPGTVSSQAGSTASCTTKINYEACKTKVEKECANKSPASEKDQCERRIIAQYANKPATASGSSSGDESVFESGSKSYQCGNTPDAVKTKFNLGCLGKTGPPNTAPIHDMAYAFIRFLSAGVGIIIVLSIIVAGIQYSSSEGNPEATQAAKTRIQNAIIGLIVYLFAFSFIQYLVPGGMFAGSMVTSRQIPIVRIMEVN